MGFAKQHCVFIVFVILVTALLPSHVLATGRFTSIFSFGDSLSDTGNDFYLADGSQKSCGALINPYGENYFGHPTGRWSDGRLIIDFIAEYLGLPIFVKPYLGIKHGAVKDSDIHQGVNFAVEGATASDQSFFDERGIYNFSIKQPLRTQLDWFKDLLPSLCESPSSCKNRFRKSLFLVGEIGLNDYNYAILRSKTREELESYVPLIISSITSAVEELINIGAMTLLVPGNIPMGCNALLLTVNYGTKNEEYDQLVVSSG